MDLANRALTIKKWTRHYILQRRPMHRTKSGSIEPMIKVLYQWNKNLLKQIWAIELIASSNKSRLHPWLSKTFDLSDIIFHRFLTWSRNEIRCILLQAIFLFFPSRREIQKLIVICARIDVSEKEFKLEQNWTITVLFNITWKVFLRCHYLSAN